MIPEKYQNLPNHIKLLFEWDSPMKRGYSYREWEDYLNHGFTDADIPTLIQLLNDKELGYALGVEYYWVPLYANRILGQLQSVEAIESIIDRTLEAEEDDATSDEGAVALAMIGKPAMPKVAGMLLDMEGEEEPKRMAAMTLAEVAQYHPELRAEVIDYFQQYLQKPHPYSHLTNGLLVSHLIDIKAVELIDEIRDLYTNEYADIGIAGDIEDVEIELGFRTERVTPKPKYHKNLPGMESLQQLFESINAGSPAEYDWNNDPNVSKTVVRDTPKVGRNEPCPCGSGKKYKRCCMNQ